MLSKDGWGGLVVAAASLLLFGLTLGLKDSPLVPIGPGFYPRVVLALTAVVGFWLVLSDFLRSHRRPPAGDAKPSAPQPTTSKPDYAAVALQFAVFALYVAALPGLGFRIATFLYVASANALMSPPRGVRGWIGVAALALATTVVTYFAFERYLSVLLPRGRWTDF